MYYAFAPMEGITDHVFRRVHHRVFPGLDRYYTPFLSPTANGPALTPKDLRQVLPENNEGLTLIPQILTNRADIFLRGAEALRALGYTEVNLNLGCPSGTVTAKGKGAGFLGHKEELERFLDEIFAACPLDISVKTRLGVKDPEEFHEILDIYRRYPMKELIVHPRVQTDLYRGGVRMEYFDEAARTLTAALCLSGGVAVREDFRRLFAEREVPAGLMLGRGLIANPALGRQLTGGADPTRQELTEFHGLLYQQTAENLGSDRNAIFRMKEVWGFMIRMFDSRDRLWRELRKATSVTEYLAVTARILRDLPLRTDVEADW